MNGGGPSAGYLAQLQAALAASGQSRAAGGDVNGVSPFGLTAAAPPTMPAMVPDAGGGYPSLGALAQAPPPPALAPAPAPAPPGPSSPNEDPARMMSIAPPQMSQGPAPYHVGVQQPGPEGIDERNLYPNDVEIRPVGGGKGTPAHEAMNKGPVQLGHYMAAFDSEEEAARKQDLRTQMQAMHEEDMYAEHARAAQAREAAAQAAVARRSLEMQRTENQFREQVDNLSQQHLDQGRLFANMSTGQKIATSILLGLGASGGGPNPILDQINKKIDRDLDAQKFDYDAGMNRAKGLHTAYSMLMDRYHEEDIALAGARTAALDYALAQVNGMKAQWKGTDSANTLDAIGGKLGADRENTLGNAMTIVAATAGGGGNEVWVRGRGGMQKLPGLKTDKEASDYYINHDAKQREAYDTSTTKAGEALTLEDRKAQHAREKQKANGKDPGNLYNVHQAFLNSAERDLVEGTGKDIEGKARRPNIPGSTSAKTPLTLLGGAIAPDSNDYEVAIRGYNAQLQPLINHWTRDEEGKIMQGASNDTYGKLKLTPGMSDREKAHNIQLAREYVAERAKSQSVPQAGHVPEAGPPDRANKLFDEEP